MKCESLKAGKSRCELNWFSFFRLIFDRFSSGRKGLSNVLDYSLKLFIPTVYQWRRRPLYLFKQYGEHFSAFSDIQTIHCVLSEKRCDPIVYGSDLLVGKMLWQYIIRTQQKVQRLLREYVCWESRSRMRLLKEIFESREWEWEC